MKRIITFLLLGLVFSASACVSQAKLVNGSGVMASKTITFSEVTGVNLATPGEMEILLGDEPSLLVEMEDNLLPYLETPVQDGRLTIRFADGVNVQPAKPIHYTLTVAGLDAIASSSTGDILAPRMVADSFSVKLSSTGNLVLGGVAAQSLIVELSSLGSLTIKDGEVADQTVALSSNGSYHAGDVLNQAAVVKISSSGDATIWVTTRLDAQISSSGNVNYYGSPETNITSSSSGRGIPLGDK